MRGIKIEPVTWNVKRPDFIPEDACRTPGDHVMVVLASEYRAVSERLGKCEELLAALSRRHDWAPQLGQCVCEEHENTRHYLKGVRK